jgi:2-methylfumaryl-CoA isomerase
VLSLAAELLLEDQSMSRGILSGLQVIEISAFVAAPLAGATLAAMGADVIRVEQLGGGIDANRWPLHDGLSLYRAGLDRGKRSLALDLRSARGQQLVQDLIRGGGDSGGIVLTNLSAVEWLSYERLREARSDLIAIVITGTPGGKPAVDYTVNAATGFPLITGPDDVDGPINHVLPAWDVAAGMMATTALLAAERHRRMTGEGQLVTLALSDVALSVAGHLGYLAEAELVAEPRGRFGNEIYGTYGRDFATRDGTYVMVCALTPRQWRSLCTAADLTEDMKAIEARYETDLSDEGSRFTHRDEITLLLEPWIGERTLAEVRDVFDANGVLWAPYRTFKEVVADSPDAGLSTPLIFSHFDQIKSTDSPTIGSDTHAILRDELGLDEPEIADLRRDGVIGSE